MRTDAEINPAGDTARETPVLIPSKLPSVSISGEPERIKSGAISVSIVCGDASSGAGASIVTSPAAMRATDLPASATTVSPSIACLPAIDRGAHTTGLPSTVVVAVTKNTKPELTSLEETNARTWGLSAR